MIPDSLVKICVYIVLVTGAVSIPALTLAYLYGMVKSARTYKTVHEWFDSLDPSTLLGEDFNEGLYDAVDTSVEASVAKIERKLEGLTRVGVPAAEPTATEPTATEIKGTITFAGTPPLSEDGEPLEGPVGSDVVDGATYVHFKTKMGEVVKMPCS